MNVFHEPEAGGSSTPADQSTDAELVERTSHGDIAAFATLYQRRYRIVYEAAKRITLSRDDALDVTSKVFADVWQRARSGALNPDRPSLAGYLSTAAKNAALDLVHGATRIHVTENGELHEAHTADDALPEFSYGTSDLICLFRALLSLDPQGPGCDRGPNGPAPATP